LVDLFLILLCLLRQRPGLAPAGDPLSYRAIRKWAKKRAPNCPRPFASLRATCVGRDAGCAAELALRFARRSNNCGKSDDEASLSFGRLATPHPAQRRRGQKGGGWGTANSQQPTANSQQPTANSQQPAPSLRSASNQGPSEAKARANSPYVSACGVVVAGLQSCRRTGLLRDLTRRDV